MISRWNKETVVWTLALFSTTETGNEEACKKQSLLKQTCWVPQHIEAGQSRAEVNEDSEITLTLWQKETSKQRQRAREFVTRFMKPMLHTWHKKRNPFLTTRTPAWLWLLTGIELLKRRSKKGKTQHVLVKMETWKRSKRTALAILLQTSWHRCTNCRLWV